MKQKEQDAVAAARGEVEQARARLAAHDQRKQKLDEQTARLTAALDQATLQGDVRVSERSAEELAKTEKLIASAERTRPTLVGKVDEASKRLRDAEQQAALSRKATRREKAEALNTRATELWRALREIRVEYRALAKQQAEDLQAAGLPVTLLPRWLLERADARGVETLDILDAVDRSKVIASLQSAA